MPRIPIDTIDDPRLAFYRALNRSNLTRHSGRFVAESKTLVLRMLAAGWPVESVLASLKDARKIAPHVSPETPLYVAPPGVIDQIVGYHFHRGALACGLRRQRPSLEHVMRRAGERATLAVCPQSQDQENLGLIVRNCAAFGADALLLGRSGVDPFSRRVVRVSMGAVFHLPIVESDDLTADLETLHRRWGVERIATVLADDAEPLRGVRRPPRVALLFGSEGHGLEERWVRLADRRVTIPMHPGADSLNVAVGTGVFLYHFADDDG